LGHDELRVPIACAAPASNAWQPVLAAPHDSAIVVVFSGRGEIPHRRYAAPAV